MELHDLAQYGGGGGIGIVIIAYLREINKNIQEIKTEIAVARSERNNNKEQIHKLEKKIELISIPERIGG